MISNMEILENTCEPYKAREPARAPVYTVEVEYTGSNAFCWKGTVDQAGNVSVIEFSQ